MERAAKRMFWELSMEDSSAKIASLASKSNSFSTSLTHGMLASIVRVDTKFCACVQFIMASFSLTMVFSPQLISNSSISFSLIPMGLTSSVRRIASINVSHN